MRLRYWTLLALVLMIISCGGGGGGDDAGGGLQLSTHSVSFTAIRGGILPDSQFVDVTITAPNAAYIIAGYPPGETEPSWLELGLSDTGGNWALSLSLKNTLSPVGVHHATVRVLIADGNQNIIAHRDLTVTCTLTGEFSVSPSQLNFQYTSDDANLPATQHVLIGGDALPWTASVNQQWVTLGSTSGTAPSTLAVGVNPAGLASGIHSATVTLSDGTTSIDMAVTFTVSNTLSASPSSLSFAYDNTGALPLDQSVSIGGYGIPWSASANQGWVTLSSTSGSAPSSLDVGADPEGLVSGIYTATLTITDGNDSYDIGITFTVSNDLSTLPQNISFSYISGDSATPPTQTVSIRGHGRSWSAAANQTWVNISSASGTGPSTIDVGVDPTAMAAGTYTASVTVSDGGESTVLGITLNVSAPSFSVTPSSIILGGSDGMSFDAQALQFSLSTGSNAYPWTATLETDSGDAWLLSDTGSGAVASADITINLDGDPAGMSAGTHTGWVELNATVNGDLITTTVPVTFNVEIHELFVADNGIALASMPTLAKLSHTVKVTDTYGLTTTAWLASSNQPWLTVTENGLTGDDLTITADANSLSTDAIHYGAVTITSTDATIQNSETIQVGFWVGALAPTDPVVIPASYTELAVDRIRPYVYVHDGGTDISVYNVYTGGHVTTITDVAQQLGPMATSSNGMRLYASDLTTGQVVPVDVETQAIGMAWDLAALPAYMRLACARPKGYDVVLASDGYAYDANDGTRLADAFIADANIVTSSDSADIYLQLLRGSPSHLYRYDMNYSALNQRGLIIENEIYVRDAGPGADLAASPDGTKVYTACGAPYEFTYYAADTLIEIGALTANAYPRNVHVGVNGYLYAGTESPLNTLKLWVYDSDDNLLMSSNLPNSGSGALTRQMAVSEDGLRIVVLTSFPNLQFITGP